MKFFSRRLTTLVAIASVTCLVSVRSVLGQEAPDAVNPSNQDYEALTNGHKKHHHDHSGHHHHHKHHGKHHHGKHHHKKPHKKPHRHKPPKVQIDKEINLVCDGYIIDKIGCPRKFPPIIMHSTKEDQATFEAQNNVIPPEQVYIVMDTPCSKDLPSNCAAARALAAQDTEESGETILAKRANEFEATNNDGKHKKDHHHGHHHHGKHHHGKKHGHGHGHGHHHHHKNKHPYQNLCVAVGDFCGSKLYGCDFDAKTHYRCSAIGEPPAIVLVDAKICGGTIEPPGDCTCPGTGDDPVCGHDLPASCSADPNTIYICRGGKGSKPEPLSECKPGTVCIKKPSPEGAACGSGTCDCEGDNEVCSSQFLDECKLEKNTIYKCTRGGKPEKVKTCDSSKTCVSVGDGAGCSNNDCKCSEDGTSCGEIFPLSCKIKTTALYTCKKGEPPVLLKDCFPDRCSASKAQLAAAAVFTSTANDKCVPRCTCTGRGPVCGSTFKLECKLEASNLYKCDGEGSTPTPSEVCGQGGCTVNNGNDKCNTDPCTCSGSGFDPICGHDLAKECNALPNVIYICRGGSGTKPEVLSQCKPGTVCIKKPSPEGAACGSGTCDCTGNKDVCSNQFLAECKLEDNTVYKCTPSGKPEKVKTCKDTQACVQVGDGAGCTNTDCKCIEDGTSCGEIFPLSCKLKTTALYTCTKGDDPKLLKDCFPDRCSASKAQFAATLVFTATANDKCAEKCTCSGKGPTCGSTFNPDCKLKPSTLYKCDGDGFTPTPGEDCKEGGCTVNNGDNKCNTDTCTCPGSGTAPVCGSELPLSCKANANTIYICRGGSGGKPEPLSECKPGTICIKRDSPEGAACGADNCDCTGNREVCSSQFPDRCGLEKNTIYKCTAGGKPEKVKVCDTTKSCVKLSDGAVCASNDCKCPDDGTVCGEVFPLSCKIKTTALYTCKKDGNPVLQKDCAPGFCSASKSSFAAAAVFEAAAAADVCTKECVCQSKGTFCGSTFKPECKLEASTLYKCDGSGSTPTPDEVCKEGGCTVSNGDNKCSADTCTCPSGTDPVCGSDLPSSCKAVTNTIYHCPGGTGTKPEILSECKPGTMCVKKSSPEGAICGSGTCDCTGKNEVCSNQFPDKCGLEKNTIYKCTPSGKPEKVKECKDNHACIVIGDDAVCSNSDCKCPDDGTICGEAFPLSCKLKTSVLYTCKKDGVPVYHMDCAPGFCSASKSSFAAAAVFEAAATADVCTKECVCQNKGPVCGSTFKPECKLEASTLYKCDGSGSTPTPGEVCKEGGCTVNNGDDKCNPSTCTCPGTGLAPVCGSELPSSCKATANTIYYCPGGSGTEPVPLSECKPGTMCIKKPLPEGAACGAADCNCKGDNEVCSSQFPDECGLEKNTIYKCTAGGKPEKVKVCDATKTCVSVGDGAGCGSNDCKCTEDGISCGEIFPLLCRLKTTALYTCKKGEAPVFQKDCAPGFCSASKSQLAAASVFDAAAADVCIPNCKCGTKGLACGSTFDPVCKLEPSTLYKCDGPGATPVPGEACKEGGCTVSNGDDSCSTSKCTCPGSGTAPVCGAELPKECNALANTIYYCPGSSGTEPKPLSECKPGTICIKKPLPEGAACGAADCSCKGDNEVCSSQFPGECGLEKNTIYKCTAGGKPEKVKVCDATKTCVSVSDGAGCVSNDCKCSDDGTICGEVFPLSCRLKTTVLYTCTKDGEPIFQKDCAPGHCSASKASLAASAIFEAAAAADVCNKECTCAGKGSVCGSTFSPDCKLEPNSLYNCDGNGATPTKGEDCKEGGCTVTNGEDHCATSKCTCPTPGTSPVCGSDLPKECKADHTKIYHCPGGTGTEPKELTACPPGSVCIKKDAPEGAACGGDTCDCTGNEEVCSSSFKDGCKLEKNAIYKCTPGGKPEKFKNCDTTESCVKLSDGPVCTNNDCKCKSDGVVCGQVFPLSCKLKTTNLYTCVEGEPPVFKEDCSPKGCVATKASMAAAAAVFEAEAVNDKCTTTNICDCQGKSVACGSTYPDSCGYDKDTIHKCDGATGKPTPGEKCAFGCNVNVGDDTCGTDFIEEKCTCPEGWNSVCGFDLPKECESKIAVEKGAIYYCPKGKGTLPEIQAICPSGLICQSKEAPQGAACGGTDCTCKGEAERCSDAFPADCSLKANTIYKCSSTGVPEEVETCPAGKVCLAIGDEAVCASDDCKCHKDGVVCGEAFRLSCKLKSTVLYTCTKGGDPVPKSDCYPERCSASKESIGAAAVIFKKMADDTCTNSCLCSGEGPTCGYSFLDHCKLKEGGLYKCDGKGAEPTLIEECKDGVCTILPGDDRCGDGKECLCIDTDQVCGNTFPSHCKFNISAIYSCKDGAGSTPQLKEVCASNKCTSEPGNDACTEDPCACKDSTAACGFTFPPSCKLDKDTVYKCAGGKGSKPIAGDKCKAGECITVAGDDGCKPTPPTDCTCPGNKAICGSNFDPTCKLDSGTLYACSGAGKDPVPGEKCASGACVTNPVGVADRCKDDCKCKDNSDVCGSAFGADCNLDSGTLYTCSGAGKDPVPGEKCASGACVTNPVGVADRCKDDCKCKDNSDVCGSAFGADCKLDSGTLYTCSGAGKDPVLDEKCASGACVTNPAGVADRCKDDCKCKDNSDVCGSAFGADCKLENNILYSCSAAGADPVLGQTCDKGCSVIAGASDQCAPDTDTRDCKCKDGDPVCGSAFKETCKYDLNVLYKCDGGKDSTPIATRPCPSGSCTIKDGPDECTPPKSDCTCQDDKPICGKEYADDCRFDKETLYTCSAAGAAPTPKDKCANGCKVNDNGAADECAKDPCACKAAGRVCGSELPAECKTVESLPVDALTIYLCDAAGATPKVQKVCIPGTVCISHADGAQCGGNSCNCAGKAVVCSNEFPDNCGLEKNTIYKCSDSGEPIKDKTCPSGTECVSNGSGAFCGNCKCSEDGTSCGSIFPLSCKLSATSLYKCTKGGDPVFEKDCLPGHCTGSPPAMGAASAVFKALAADTCAEDCACETADDLVCGFTFPERCGLEKQSLYKCTAIGAKPTDPQSCDPNVCVAQPGLDSCDTTPPLKECFCTDDKAICFKSLSDTCKRVFPADTPAETILSCSGKGAAPKVQETCKEDQICDKPAADQPAVCKDLCECTGTDTKCSKDFTPACKLPAEGVYKCGASGKPEKVEDCTAPDTCKVYTDGPKCTPEECVCKDDGKHCGITFDDKCNLTDNTLYSCVTGQVPKEEKDCNPGVCSSNNKPPTNATGDEFCIDKCACKVANEDLCSSTFDAACNYKANTLMHCDAINSTPTEKETCTTECTVKDGSDECKIDPCACRKNGDTCGSTFPPKCNFEDNSLYTCTGNKTTPTKKEACDPMSICTPVAGGNDVCGASNDCECVGKKPTCGSNFPPACNYKPDDLVMCPNHTAITTCPEGCADGECKTGCKCTTDVAVCGSSFADKCNLIPNAVYNCKNGEDPVLAEDCGDKLCIKGVDPTAADETSETVVPAGFMEADAVEPAKCGDYCTCKDNHKTCGSAFAQSCKLEPTALYECTAPGATPAKLENCTSACEYTQPEHSCKHDCSAQVTSVTKQIDLIIEQMEILMETYKINISGSSNVFNPAGSVTLYAYPPFIKALDQIKADLTKDAARPEKLGLQAGTFKKTIIGAGKVMVSIMPLFPKENVNVTLPLIQDMRDLIPLIDTLIACTGGNKSDCSGITKLMKDFNDQTIEYLNELAETAGDANVTIKDMTQQINNVTMIIDDVFKTRNDSTLPEAGKLLNGIIGVISAKASIYQQAANPVNMYFEAAKEALRCEGFNITVFADKCSAYGDRLQGALANIIEWIQKALNNIPVIGPIFTTPILEAIKQVAITLQNGGGAAVGRVVGMLVGILNMFGLVPDADSSGESQTDGILALLGIADVAGDCGGKKARCMGAIEIAKILIQSLVDYIIGNIPFGFGKLLAPVINGIVDAIAKGLNAVSSAGIGIVIGALKGAAFVINLAFLNLFKDLLNTFITGLEDIARCLVTSEDANDTDVPPTQSLISGDKTRTIFF